MVRMNELTDEEIEDRIKLVRSTKSKLINEFKKLIGDQMDYERKSWADPIVEINALKRLKKRVEDEFKQ